MSAEIHFIHSGNGDTILVTCGERWGLIDSNFVAALKVREQVESLLAGVDRLAFVCVTHFDQDHIRGLADFLSANYCDREGGRVVRWRFDQLILPISTITAQLIGNLSHMGRELGRQRRPSDLKRAKLGREAAALMRLVEEIIESDPSTLPPKITCLSVGEDVFSANGDEESPCLSNWMVTSLGPSNETSQKYSFELLDLFGAEIPIRNVFDVIERNETSRILAFINTVTGAPILLTGDATNEEIVLAIKAWIRKCGSQSLHPFVAIKVSHHGAHTCHEPYLYSACCVPGESKAVICAADDGEHHPHTRVIDDLKRHGITYSVTGSSTSRRRGGPFGGLLVSGDLGRVSLRFDNYLPTMSGGRLSCLH